MSPKGVSIYFNRTMPICLLEKKKMGHISQESAWGRRIEFQECLISLFGI